MRIAVAEAARDRRARAAPAHALRALAARQPETDVLRHGQMREERVVLEHHSDPALLRRHPGALTARQARPSIAIVPASGLLEARRSCAAASSCRSPTAPAAPRSRPVRRRARPRRRRPPSPKCLRHTVEPDHRRAHVRATLPRNGASIGAISCAGRQRRRGRGTTLAGVPLASVYPLVSTRSLARPFTYEVPEGTGKGAVVSVRLGRRSVRGVVADVGVDRAAGRRAGRRRGTARRGSRHARRPRALARRLLRLDAGACPRARRPDAQEAARRAAVAGRPGVARGRAGAGVAHSRPAGGRRADRRRARRGGRRARPPRGADRQRQDRGLPPGLRRGARAWPGDDRPRPGDRARAADRRALPAAVRRHRRDPPLVARRRGAPRRARPHRARRGADRRRGSLGDLRGHARGRADRRRRGARRGLQAGVRPAVRRAHGRGEARGAGRRGRRLRVRHPAARELVAAPAVVPLGAHRRPHAARAAGRPPAGGGLPAVGSAARRARPSRRGRRPRGPPPEPPRRRTGASTAARAACRDAASSATSP